MVKHIRTGFLKQFNALIGLLLSLLGFGAVCSLNSCEYGTPYAAFIVRGNVKSSGTSSNLPGIQVIMRNDTTYTDTSGNYRVEIAAFPDDQTSLVEFRDTDGKKNGEHHSLDTIVDFHDPDFTGGSDTWDKGETGKELHVKLKVRDGR